MAETQKSKGTTSTDAKKCTVKSGVNVYSAIAGKSVSDYRSHFKKVLSLGTEQEAHLKRKGDKTFTRLTTDEERDMVVKEGDELNFVRPQGQKGKS